MHMKQNSLLSTAGLCQLAASAGKAESSEALKDGEGSDCFKGVSLMYV